MKQLKVWEFQWGRSEREVKYIAAENFSDARQIAVEWIRQERPHWMDVGEDDILAIKMADQRVIVS